MNYYQHHIGDFNNATRHLSLIERAIYRDLLDMYYDTEKAIDASSIDRLARRLQCTTEDQKEALKYVLDEFFTLEEGEYRNNRCEREIAEFHGKKKQASEAGKASAAKRAAKKKGSNNGGSSNDDQASNENSTVVENQLSEENTGVQPTNNHKPLTSNQDIDSSSKARGENPQLPPIQFAQYQNDDHKRYSMREFISEYNEFQYDFISLAQQRFVSVPEIDLRTMIQNFGDWYFANESSSANTPSLWLVKWFSWVQNNEKQIAANRKKQEQITTTGHKPQEPGYFANLFEEHNESQIVDVTPAKKFPMIEEIGHA
ncbi:YdaU family protein [Acinetobacter geminorum]|uniref:YdaU family protein n=1 Tax=Acinetobacter geminorum TaxID=2730922 RepID=UPI003AF73CD7